MPEARDRVRRDFAGRSIEVPGGTGVAASSGAMRTVRELIDPHPGGAVSRSLDLYRHARLIVQRESTTAVEAARAMQTNEIGCVLVSDGRGIVGIVTDRDLALRVVGAGRVPGETRLGTIMSSPVAMLDVNAPHASAVALMKKRRFRRVPLVDGPRAVGMVTLDDLVLERTATLEELVGIVEAQIVEGGPARTRRFDEWTSLARRHSRALGTKAKLLSNIRAATLLRKEQAESALVLVLEALVGAVEDEVRPRLIQRLPVALRSRMRELPPGPRRTTTQRQLVRRVGEALGFGRARAEAIVLAVGAALVPFVRASDPVGRKLPADLRALVAARSSRGARARRREDPSELR